jgi:hypothetical protein
MDFKVSKEESFREWWQGALCGRALGSCRNTGSGPDIKEQEANEERTGADSFHSCPGTSTLLWVIAVHRNCFEKPSVSFFLSSVSKREEI